MSRRRTSRAAVPSWMRPHVVLIGCLLVVGLLLRLPGIAEPSIEQRETQSALLARQWYLDEASLPAWQQRVLRELPELVKPIEPPVLDVLAAWQFRAAGENFWFPRLVSSLLWVIGGVFLYLIAVRLTTREGSIVALALYLTWPFAVWLSRHFMPDAMMVCLLLAATLAVLRYWERPSTGRLVVAGGVAAVATASKPGVAFFFLGALFVAIAASRRELRRTVVRGDLPIFTALAVLPTAVYYIVGTHFSDFIWSGADDGRVTPRSIFSGWFWPDWWEAVSHLLRYPQNQALLALLPLAAAAAGIAVARKGITRPVIAGLLLGYVAFALTAANYVSGNPYYSLPLIPILALSIGVLGGYVLERGGAAGRFGRPAVLALVAAVVGVAAYKSYAVLEGSDTDRAVADYQEIGELTGHTTRAVVVDNELSTPVMYWGWIVGRSWEIDDGERLRLPQRIASEQPELLIVVGAGPLGSPGLRTFTRDLPVVARTSRYAIFDLRRA